jgi:ABC-type transport system involved in multi-copper enzyme maturation permease subunit
MSIVPVIARELRAQSRQPLTHLLRVIGGLAIFSAFGLAFWSLSYDHSSNSYRAITVTSQFQNFGVALFGKLNLTIFIAIWIFAPLAAADAISRERREGTLPLLRLTKLRPWEILCGKSFVHMLRSSTLFCTMAPWLMIPLLFGGVGPNDLAMALILDAAALCLAGSAGLLASTFSRDWVKSVLCAEAIALFLLLGMLDSYGKVLVSALSGGAAPAPMRWGGLAPANFWNYQFGLVDNRGLVKKNLHFLDLITSSSVTDNTRWAAFSATGPANLESPWQELWTAMNPVGRSLWFTGSLQLLAAALLTLAASVWLGSWRVKRSWQDKPEAAALERFKLKYLTPKYGVSSLRKRLARALNRNPIGWLHQYSPSARLMKWGWCLFLIVVELLLCLNVNDLYGSQGGLGFFLLMGLIFSSSASFRNELETGAFELLLVTPIREFQILSGRVRGIWEQFLPAFVIYAVGTIFLASGWSHSDLMSEAWHSLGVFALLALTAPVVGLYFSLVRWNFLVSWIAASIFAWITPMLLINGFGVGLLYILPVQLLIALLFAWRVVARLHNRLALTVRA